MRVYEWVKFQLQDGKAVTAADMSAQLQNKLNQLDGDILNSHQLVEHSANQVQLEDSMLNTQQPPEQLANGTQRPKQSVASGDTNGTATAFHDQEMDIN